MDLPQKYEPRHQGQKLSNQEPVAVTEPLLQMNTGSKLDQLEICGLCQGHRLVTYIYNHMRLQKNCTGTFICYPKKEPLTGFTSLNARV